MVGGISSVHCMYLGHGLGFNTSLSCSLLCHFLNLGRKKSDGGTDQKQLISQLGYGCFACLIILARLLVD